LSTSPAHSNETPTRAAPSVLLVEDHTMVRTGVRALLEASKGFRVVGEAADGNEAVRLALELSPNVVVMDVALPGLSGIEATRQIRKARPQTFVVVLSMYGDRQYIAESLRAGATAYLLKDAAFTELLTALEAVVAGKTYLSPAVSSVALDDYIHRVRSDGEPKGLEKLSAREREVLQHIADGKTSGEIGEALHISGHTVDTHRRKIMEKLDVHNVVDLVKFAIRNGLASLD
jgi:DNA-binding NarL/FixJ family response regulator